jgi:hypothetical protein
VIDFRYHLVSIIAVFVALAVGIVLGSGPLKEPIDSTLRQRYEQVEKDKTTLRNQLTEAESRISYLERATATYAPTLVGGRLHNRNVLVIAMPDADGRLVNDTRDVLGQSGATVSGTLRLTDAYSDPERLSDLEAILDRLTPAGTPVPAGARPYVRAGAVLARALVTRTPVGKPDEESAALLTALQDGGFLTLEGRPAVRAPLVVIITTAAPSSPGSAERTAADAHLEIALAVDRTDSGTVAAGPIGAADDGGLIAAIRTNEEASGRISTVDTLDTVIGRISAVLALSGQLGDVTGHFGIGPDADEIAPDLPAEDTVGAPQP